MANDAGPEAKQWALAATAVLTTLTRREPRYDLLGGAPKTPDPEATSKTILANSWNIDGRDKLISTLEWLGGGGHSQDYAKAAAAFAQATPDQKQQDPKLAVVNQLGTEIGNRGLLAWDLGRLLAVAGWGYLAGYCSEDEAWGAIFSAGVRLRGTYGSWEEYGKHYRFGALFWDATATAQIDPILAQLSSAPTSPWRTVAWSLDGAAAAAPMAGGYGAPPGAAPGGGGFPAPAGASPGVVGGAPGGVMGGAPAPIGPPGAPPPPGSPGAPTSYSGVPVINAPPGGGPPPPYGMSPSPGGMTGPGAAAAGKGKMMLIVGAGGGVVFLLLAIMLVWHFAHRHEAPAHEGPAHGEEHGRHGRH
jgi:hypothetical protein